MFDLIGNDISLSIGSMFLKNGEVVKTNIKLPIHTTDIEFPYNPDDVIMIGMFENLEGVNNLTKFAFNIYVGKASLEEINNTYDNYVIKDENLSDIIKNKLDDNTEFAYFVNEEGKRIIYALVGENDIAVNNSTELGQVLFKLSMNMININKSVTNIRKLTSKGRK